MGIKLGLSAFPFGFGPVSKAVAIAKALSAKHEIQWHAIGSGISLEFMRREGFANSFTDTSQDSAEEVTKNIQHNADAAVVLMDPEWANNLAPHMDVFYADSLGYMWEKEDFDDFPDLDKLKKYYVQDLFNSYNNMLSTEQPNVVSVPPILHLPAHFSSAAKGRPVIHLGGLLNPMNPDTSRVYISGIQEIITSLDLGEPIILMSQTAKDTLAEDLGEYDCRAVPHDEALGLMKSASFLLSSPGLTTLLETAALDIPSCPLPPQNYSQVLNVRNMVNFYGDKVDPVWHFLNEEYGSITAGMPEIEGVRKITALNKEKLSDSDFTSRFSELLSAAIKRRTSPVQELKSSTNGAEFIARDISQNYLSKQQPQTP